MLPKIYSHVVQSSKTLPINTYEWWDEVNCSLTRIDVVVHEYSVEVEIYKSPIMMKDVDNAVPHLELQDKETYGKEFIKVLAHAISCH